MIFIRRKLNGSQLDGTISSLIGQFSALTELCVEIAETADGPGFSPHNKSQSIEQ